MSADDDRPEADPRDAPSGGSLWAKPDPSAPVVQPTPLAPGASANPSAPQFVAPDRGRATFVKPSEAPVTIDQDRPWRWFVGPTTFVVAFLLLFVFITAIFIVAGRSFAEDHEQWVDLGQEVLWISVALLMPFLFVGHLTSRQLGLRRPPRWGIAIAVFVATYVVFIAVAAAYSLIFDLNNKSNTLLSQDSGFGESVGKDIALAILYPVAAPVAEELIFRALMFRSLRDGITTKFPRSGMWMAAVISGVIFGGIHYGGGQNKFIPVLMAFGILLALAYHFSGTLYIPILIHSVNNAVATASSTHPTHSWIYWLIGAGPVLALLLAFLVSRFVGVVFPPEPKNSAHPPSAEPAIV